MLHTYSRRRRDRVLLYKIILARWNSRGTSVTCMHVEKRSGERVWLACMQDLILFLRIYVNFVNFEWAWLLRWTSTFCKIVKMASADSQFLPHLHGSAETPGRRRDTPTTPGQPS